MVVLATVEGRVGGVEREPTTGRPTPDDHDAERVETPSRREQLRSTARNLVLAVVAVAGLGLLSGWLFARSAPQTAAATSISALVQEVEPPDPPAEPAPLCGTAVPSDVDADAVRAAGVVVIYADPADHQQLVDVVGDRPVLVVSQAPDEGVVEATSLGRRMALDELNPSTVDAFITAYARPGACEG